MATPTKYNIQLLDNYGSPVAYIDDKITSMFWEWDRVGGCGLCKFTLRESFDGALAATLRQDYEINTYVNGTLYYSGFIDKIMPRATGKGESISVTCLGYINQLKRIVLRDETYSGKELSFVAEDIVEVHGTGETSVTSAATDYDETDFVADNLYFNESIYDALVKIAGIAGKREWGVKADKSLYFLKRDDSVKHWYHIKQDFISFSPTIDYNPIITRIYLLGSDNYSGRFTVTNKVVSKEQIVQNSAISTQSVGQQFARMYLKEKSMIRRSYYGTLVRRTDQVESIVPMGEAAVNIKIGVKDKYDTAGNKYDSGQKYDGGTESFQIEKIRYDLTDHGLQQTLYFGQVPPAISDELKRLEFMIKEERNV